MTDTVLLLLAGGAVFAAVCGIACASWLTAREIWREHRIKRRRGYIAFLPTIDQTRRPPSGGRRRRP